MNAGVTLGLVDQYTAPLRAFQQQLQALTQAAQNFNRAFAGSGSASPFGRMGQEVRSLTNDMRALVGQVSQLGRAMGTAGGGNFSGRQITDMRQLLSMQQQALANNARLLAGPAGPGGPGGRAPGASGWFGRSGFNPNASLVDRAQYRAVNFGEQFLLTGMLELSRARTRLSMLALERPDPNNPDEIEGRAPPSLPGVISQETVRIGDAQRERWRRYREVRGE
jgi:hypothetical protein